MKFSGIHIHMALVVGLICVIVYLFYISKDILALDEEVMKLKKQVQSSQQCVKNNVQLVGQTCEPVQFQKYSTNGMNNTQGKHAHVGVATEKIAISNDDDGKSDTYSEVDSEKIRQVLNNMRRNDDDEDTDSDTDSLEDSVGGDIIDAITTEAEQQQVPLQVKSYTLVELKNLCKEKGVSTKGTKEQLKERLGL
jgi:SAP domain